jgi:chromosome condensin MukBEF complex kleisin-like MukF subunit
MADAMRRPGQHISFSQETWDKAFAEFEATRAKVAADLRNLRKTLKAAGSRKAGEV